MTDLRDAGFIDTDIGAVYANTAAAAARVGAPEGRIEHADEDVGPGGGAVAGAVTGGLIWLAMGPLGALVGAVGGAVVGSITAGLVDLGHDEEEARWHGR